MGINIANGDMIFQRENGIYGFVMMIYVNSWGLNPKRCQYALCGKKSSANIEVYNQPSQVGDARLMRISFFNV